MTMTRLPQAIPESPRKNAPTQAGANAAHAGARPSLASHSLSVIIPAYNEQSTIQEVLRTVRAVPVVTQIVAFCTENMQTIDHDTQDKLLHAGWDADAQTRATAFVADFETFCAEHRDRLDALTIYFSQPQRRQEVTLAQIQDVLAALQQHAPRLAPLRVWDAYARLDALPANARPLTELTALVALLRRACGLDRKLTPFADTVRRHYRDWILRANAGQPFNAQQTAWL